MNKEKLLLDILKKYSLSDVNKEETIINIIDSLSLIRLILNIEKELKIQIKIESNLKIKDLHEKII